jgi:putative photosynthetic complex assembly protein
MSQTMHHEPFPRAALIGAAVLIGGALILAAVGRSSGIGTTSMPAVAAAATRDLRFVDRRDGSVAVYDTAGNEIATLAPGTNGFARGVMRGFARSRKLEAIGDQPPFRMTRWTDGRLSLSDPATGRIVDLDAFGPTNAEVFARLMTAAGGGMPDAAAPTHAGEVR